jgi:hypothetical protein
MTLKPTFTQIADQFLRRNTRSIKRKIFVGKMIYEVTAFEALHLRDSLSSCISSSDI